MPSIIDEVLVVGHHDPVIVSAFLDRLLRHSAVINIKGNSYRLKGRLAEKEVKEFNKVNEYFAMYNSVRLHEKEFDNRLDHLIIELAHDISKVLINSTSFVNKRLKMKQNISVEDLSDALELTEADIKDDLYTTKVTKFETKVNPYMITIIKG